ncbi:uncharacterized protein [Primulina huaijiensis]|uniref:uncharacterized protein isoform X2 n=1 Tax=Primulina huaijiensis TaxID=1492673 RepID=UPI003CC791EE
MAEDEGMLLNLNEKQQFSDSPGDQIYSKLNTVSEIQEPTYLIKDATGLTVSGKFSEEDFQETEKKREKKPRRRRAKHRKNKDTVNRVIAFEKKENKGLVYSRKEMEALRFEDLDGQKKKWLEVYCGLCPSEALEYDDLVNSDDNFEPTFCFDFDPRPQFLKASPPPPSASTGEHLDHLDPTYCLPVYDEISCSGAEEEYSPVYGSDEDYSSLQKPAFLVLGEPDFDSGPPQDGLEYLRRVRWEASHFPEVTIAKIEKSIGIEQTVYMPQIPEIMDCQENLLPIKQWEDCFLAYFSELRLSVITEYFNSLLSGYDPSTSEASSSPHALEEPNATGSLSSILEMESAARTSMLKKRISLTENISTLTRNDCLWLFALCVAVDSPLDADTSSSLRSLLRKCASLRAAKANADDEVVMLNILATISGRYFGQSEKLMVKGLAF